MSDRTQLTPWPLKWMIPAAMLASGGLFLLSEHNYLLYHGIVEIFAVAVAFSIFAVGWHTRRFAGHSVFAVLAGAYLAVGGLDLLHVLSHEGMGVFTGRSPNLPAQLWIAARYVEAFSLLGAGLLLYSGRRLQSGKILLLYLAAGTALVVLIVPLGLFPAVHVAGTGLTWFKVGSEYIICGLLAVAGYLIWQNGAAFGRKALSLLVASVLVTLLAELSFTLHRNGYGFFNTLGHLLKLLSFGLIYGALVSRTLSQPCEALFGEMTRSKESLQHLKDRLQKLITLNADGIMVVDVDGIVRFVNPATARMLEIPAEKLIGHPLGYPVGGEAPHEMELLGAEGGRTVAEMRVRETEWEGSPAKIISLRDVTQRKRLEERYRAIFETTGSATIITEPDTTISLANQAFEDLSGYSRAEIEGKMSWTRIVMPNDLPRMKEYSRLRKTDPNLAPDRYEFSFRSKDGEAKNVLANIRLIEGTGQVLASLTDITELKRAEKALRQSEHRFKATFEQAAVGMALIEPDGSWLRANDRLCEIVGYERDELMQKTFQEITHPDDVEADVRNARSVLDGEAESYQMEKRYLRADGSMVWANLSVSAVRDESGDLEYFVGVVEDITERKRAESELRIRDRAIEASLNGMGLTDLEGTITGANPAAVSMWGYEDRSRLVGRPATEFWASVETAREAFSVTLEEGEWAGEMVARRQDGSTFPVQVAMSLVTDGQGRATHTVGFFRDITDRKEAERELREAYDELRETQRQLIDQERQRALSEMASGIAHDFNNALSTIRGFSELLLNSPEKASNREILYRYLHYIDTAASHAAETVRRMRKFYRPADDQDVHERLNVNALVEEALSMTRPRWEHEAQAQGRKISMLREFQDVPTVRGSESELHEMVTNLIFNAVDAIEEEGTITVATRPDNEHVILEVRDTGRGMDAETRNHCLDPFFTTKVETGTGLGLSVTQGIVRRHEGDIEIESEVGVGTTVRASLPAAKSGMRQEKAPRERDLPDGLKVLVVEDDNVQRELLAEILGSEGHTVELAADGREGIEKFDAGWYNLVITDRAMPEMNGDEVAQLVKERAPEKPVIMLTGFGEMMDAADETPDGVDVVVSKPVGLMKLKEAIGTAVGNTEKV